MTTELTIEKREQEDHGVRFLLRGTVNLATSPQLLAALRPALVPGVKAVTVDLSAVETIDTSGIATLVEGLIWSRETGGLFRLTGVSDRVRDTLGLAGLQGAFTIV